VSFGLLACLLTWPLPRHLQTDLLGPVSADLGVYIWNFWVFGYELLHRHHDPFSTELIFAYTGASDFALHNYAAVSGLLGIPLVPLFGLIGAFNVVLISVVAASGWGAFILARRLGLSTIPAWSAGALFMASPALVARQTAHFSLVIAAPLPLFLWALLRTLDKRRIGDAVLTGIMAAVASYSDAYYGIYCALMGAFVVAWRFTSLDRRHGAHPFPRLARGLNVSVALLVILMAWRLVSGTSALTLGPIRIGLQTLYSPALVLVVLVSMQVWMKWRPMPRLSIPLSELLPLIRLGLVAVASCAAVLVPVLTHIVWRVLNHRLPETVTYWRSSARGVDLLAYLVPNPNHPWFGERTAGWFISEWADARPEFISSFSLVALAIIAVGAWHRSLPRLWVAFTAFFVALSLGPFVHIAGIGTYVIGPWALLRYVPIIELARAPSRFAIVAGLGLCLLFAYSLETIVGRLRLTSRATRYSLMSAIAVALILELIPAPRRLYSAAIPDVYQLLATKDQTLGALLELPTGILDGTEMIGSFSASSQYYQTMHGRPLVGGYLSRVSRWTKAENERSPMLNAIFALSAGRNVTPDETSAAEKARDAFLARSCVSFVLINKRAASPQLQTFAADILRLALVHEDADYVLLVPSNPPPCERMQATAH